MKTRTTFLVRAAVVVVAVIALVGCTALESLGLTNKKVIRRSGQVELFYVDYDPRHYSEAARDLHNRLSSGSGTQGDTPTHGRVGILRPAMSWSAPRRDSLLGEDGESIRYSDDVVTIQVHGGHLYSLPWTLTGSTDIVLFAEVWENAAMGPSARSLNAIVHIGRTQLLPGRMNFEGSLAYGPTSFKGHPLKIKFTLVVLQHERSEQMSNATEVLQSLVSAAGSASLSGILSSEAIGIVRQILRSQPDVEAFDFEVTFVSDEPEILQEPLVGGSIGRKPSTSIVPPKPSPTKPSAMSSASAVSAEDMMRQYLLLRVSDTIYWSQFSPAAFRQAFELLRSASNASQWFETSKQDANQIAAALKVIDKFLAENMKNYDSLNEFDLLALAREGKTSPEVELAMLTIAAFDMAILAPHEPPAIQVGASNQQRSREVAHPRFNWLRYGTYALVETKQRSENRQYLNAKSAFWHENFVMLGNWLATLSPNKQLQPGGESEVPHLAELQFANANYICFSIVPRQLEQHHSSIRAASALSENMLRLLAGRSEDPAKLAEDVKADFVEAIDRDSLTSISREVARQYKDESILDIMTMRHAEFCSGLEVGVRRERAQRHAHQIQEMWRWRVGRHKPAEGVKQAD